MARSTSLAVAIVLAASCPRDASAEDCTPQPGGSALALSTCIEVDNLWARPGGGPFASVGSGLTAAPGGLSFALLASYASRPLRLEIASPDAERGRSAYVVDNVVSGSFAMAFGVTDRLELSLVSPVTFYQDGSGYGAVLGGETTPTRSVARDPRFGVGYALVPRARVGSSDGLSLVGRFELGVPLGDGSAFAGAGAATYVPSITGELRRGRFLGAAELGARIRPERPIADVSWGSQLSAALGGSVQVYDPWRLAVGLEAFALAGLTAREGGSAPPMPIEWLGSVRTAPWLGGDLAASLGGGTSMPISDSNATAPRFRVTLGLSYTPRGLDLDGDGVLDRDDRCPDVPEDRDGFQDADGCPEPDNDGDGIPDERDRCRDEAETFDGYQDEDGCPDLDDDGDGIPDEEDACRNEPEDVDGFEDQDGCPDPDNDGDGIPDERDLCPRGPEDRDGFRDDDGCPDPDNDLDGIPDAADRCPDEAEDRDGFQDEDGCPDPDNDGDGVPDSTDLCPNAPETIDGRDDDDGCPEPGAKSLVALRGGRVEFASPARFTARSSQLSAELRRQLEVAARLLRTTRGTIVLEAWPDLATDERPAAQDLAAQRAERARQVLVEAGIAPARITAAAGEPTPRAAGASSVEITLLPESNRR